MTPLLKRHPHLCALALTAMTGCVINAEGPDTQTPEPAPEPLPESTERILLHEMFTGSTCGPCYGADEILVGVLADNPGEYTLVSYQIGSDPYISDEGVARRMYYLPGESSYAIPMLHVDGVHALHPTQHNDDAGYQQIDFDAFQATPAFIQLAVQHTVSDQTVDFEVELMPLAELDSTELVLHAAIIEGVTTGNIGSNGQTEFHHVMKKMVPDEDGTPLAPLRRGEPVSLSLSYTFQGDYSSETGYGDPVQHAREHTVEEFEDLSVVVWVQDDESWQVHQSAWSDEGH